MHRVEIKRVINAPIEKVFAEISNHEGYVRFAGVDKAELIREGDKERNGMGAVRHLQLGKLAIDEEIVGFDVPENDTAKMEYRITRMKPKLFHHILGRVLLTEADGKTTVVWSSEFEVPVPVAGPMIEKLLAKPFGQGFAGMLKAVDKLVS